MEYTSLKDVLMVLVYMAAIDYYHIKFGGKISVRMEPSNIPIFNVYLPFYDSDKSLMVTRAQKFLVLRWSRRRCFLILWHVPQSPFFSTRTRYFAVSVNRDSVPVHATVPGSLSQSC